MTVWLIWNFCITTRYFVPSSNLVWYIVVYRMPTWKTYLENCYIDYDTYLLIWTTTCLCTYMWTHCICIWPETLRYELLWYMTLMWFWELMNLEQLWNYWFCTKANGVWTIEPNVLHLKIMGIEFLPDLIWHHFDLMRPLFKLTELLFDDTRSELLFDLTG